jgi:hypothetical protein
MNSQHSDSDSNDIPNDVLEIAIARAEQQEVEDDQHVQQQPATFAQIETTIRKVQIQSDSQIVSQSTTHQLQNVQAPKLSAQPQQHDVFVLQTELGKHFPTTFEAPQQLQIPTFINEPIYANIEHIKDILPAEDLVRSQAYQNDSQKYTAPTQLTLNKVVVAIHIGSMLTQSVVYITKISIPAYTDCHKHSEFHKNIIQYAREAILQLEPYASMKEAGVQACINMLPATYPIFDYRTKAHYLVQVNPTMSEAVFHALPPPKIKFRESGEHTCTFNVTFTVTFPTGQQGSFVQLFGPNQQGLSRQIQQVDAATETYDIRIIRPIIDAFRNNAPAATTAMNDLLYTNKTLEPRSRGQATDYEIIRQHLIGPGSSGHQEGTVQQRLGPPIQRRFRKRKSDYQQ